MLGTHTDLIQERLIFYIQCQVLIKDKTYLLKILCMFELVPKSETKFVVKGFLPEVTYEFFKNENGEVEKLRIQQIETGLDQTKVLKKKSELTISTQ